MSTDTPTPETSKFMTRIDDSEIDLGMVEAKLSDFERERDTAIKERDEARRERDELKAVLFETDATYERESPMTRPPHAAKVDGYARLIAAQKEAAELRAWRNEAEGELIKCGENIGQLCVQVEKLRGAVQSAKALSERLELIHNDDLYQAVWTLNHVRCGPYTGPKYVDELMALREALAETGAIAEATKSNITLIRRESSIDGPWCEWECEVEMPDGSTRRGYVQSDGHLIANETLQLDSEPTSDPAARDTARLDWLENSIRDTAYFDGSFYLDDNTPYPTLREAIDAAVKEPL